MLRGGKLLFSCQNRAPMYIPGITVFCLFLLAGGSVADSYKRCCAPSQFESTLGLFGATAQASPVPVVMNQRLSYDYDGRQMTIVVYENKKEIERLIYKYNQNKFYVITPDKMCRHYAINGTMNAPCIPDEAVMTGGFYLGAQDERLNLTSFYFQQAELNLYGSVTPKTCYPATEGYYGETAGDAVLMTIVYMDTTAGIADPSVFDVPSQCAQGGQEKIHFTARYVVNKFTH